MKVDDVMKKIGEAVAKDGEAMVKKVKAVFLFEFKGGDKWLLDLKNGKGSLKQGEGKADATIIIGEEDFIAMTTGKLQAMQAFMQGKMKIKGNMMLAQKLGPVLQSAK